MIDTAGHAAVTLIMYKNLFFIHGVIFFRSRYNCAKKLNHAAALFSTKSRLLSRGSREYRDSTVKFYPA